jgi:AcrR family transcriptional regulator
MGHREDLLDGAKRCLYEKGYTRTTARDIVAASGTNLGSIGYHFGSKEELMNEALLQALEEWGDELQASLPRDLGDAATPTERFERFWEAVIASFERQRQLWAATFEVFATIDRHPELRKAFADGLHEVRGQWAELLAGIDPADERAQAVGGLYQALLSGVIAQWLIDPERAPSAADLTRAVSALPTASAARRSSRTPRSPRP